MNYESFLIKLLPVVFFLHFFLQRQLRYLPAQCLVLSSEQIDLGSHVDNFAFQIFIGFELSE